MIEQPCCGTGTLVTERIFSSQRFISLTAIGTANCPSCDDPPAVCASRAAEGSGPE